MRKQGFCQMGNFGGLVLAEGMGIGSQSAAQQVGIGIPGNHIFQKTGDLWIGIITQGGQSAKADDTMPLGIGDNLHQHPVNPFTQKGEIRGAFMPFKPLQQVNNPVRRWQRGCGSSVQCGHPWYDECYRHCP